MKVLLTHSEGRLEGLAAALGAHGFRVSYEPLIETTFLPAHEVGDAARKLLELDWLLFSSRTAVQAWADLGLGLNTCKIGVVGQKTALEVTRSGGTVSLTAEPANADGLLQTFSARVSPPAGVGLPCAERALPTLSAGLGHAGFTAVKVVLYRTATHSVTHTDADLIVLASPSAVAALPEASGHARLVALGSSTQQAVTERGWHAVEAPTPDIEGVVQAVRAAAPLEV